MRWDLVRGIAPGIVAGGLLAGAGVFALIKGPQLAIVFALFIGFSATADAARPQAQAPRARCPARSARRRWAAASGLLSGLVGAGGAFIAAPFMTWCNVPMHQAVATSAALGFPVALASTAGYLISGWGPCRLPCRAPSATCTCRRC